MTIICNDVLTRVRPMRGVKTDGWPMPVVYRVGDQGDKNGMAYTVKAFGAWIHRLSGVPPLSREHPRIVWLVIKYRGDRAWKWDSLLIGDTESFREKLVFGGQHPNPIFTHYLSEGADQPLG